MEARELGDVERGDLVHRQRLDAVGLALGRHELLGRRRQGQPPEMVLHGDLPG